MLVFGGATDGIAPIPAVKAVVPLLTGSAEVRFEIVPGGHLGMLTGRGARGTTWRVMDEWIEQWSSRTAGEEGRAAEEVAGQEGAGEEGAGQEGAAKKSASPRVDRLQPDPALRLGRVALAVPLTSGGFSRR